MEISEVSGNEIDNGRYVLQKGSIPRIEVELLATEDLLNLARSTENVVRYDAYLCDDSSNNVLIIRSPVLVGGQDINELRYQTTISSTPNEEGFYSYTLFLGLYSPYINGVSIQFSEYDLVRKNEDICLRVETRSMIGGYRSNVVVLPAKKVKILTRALVR